MKKWSKSHINVKVPGRNFSRRNRLENRQNVIKGKYMDTPGKMLCQDRKLKVICLGNRKCKRKQIKWDEYGNFPTRLWPGVALTDNARVYIEILDTLLIPSTENKSGDDSINKIMLCLSIYLGKGILKRACKQSHLQWKFKNWSMTRLHPANPVYQLLVRSSLMKNIVFH